MSKRKFIVKVVTTFKKEYVVEADNCFDAADIVRNTYDSADFIDTDDVNTEYPTWLADKEV